LLQVDASEMYLDSTFYSVPDDFDVRDTSKDKEPDEAFV
jgi:hypothetical protein